MDSTEVNTADLMSIGQLAKATGISSDTIRVWERRYGKPVPIRLPSGHRRYNDDHLAWLRRVAEALQRGNRPGKVVRSSDEELAALVAREPDPEPSSSTPEIQAMVQMVRTYDAITLVGLLRDAYRSMGAVRLLDQRVAPLLTRVGALWRDGTLKIRHEHFVTEVMQDFLRRLRSEFEVSFKSPTIVLATLPDEEHGLGVQMCAVAATTVGVRPHILGRCTPIAETVAATQECDAKAVGIGVSLSSAGIETDRQLALLRQSLPAACELVVGGVGARGTRRGPRGIEYFSDLRQFARWAQTLVSR